MPVDHDHDFELPLVSQQFQPTSSLRRIVFTLGGKRQRLRLYGLLLCVVVSALLLVSWSHKDTLQEFLPSWSPDLTGQKDVPLYERFYKSERNLPQHNESLPFPEGKNGRFVWVSSQHWGLGWNNILQALYMLNHMAYMSNRAFAFKPYIWHLGSEQVVEYEGEKRASQIPLTALLAGPMGGGPFPSGHSAPRAVTEEWYHKMCPPEMTTVLSVQNISEGLEDGEVIKIMDKYVATLKEVDAGCVELRAESMEHPFSFQQFGTSKLLSMWPSLSVSPIMTEFAWSSLVLSALQANAYELTHQFAADTLPRVGSDFMAVHLRRGDYDKHCHLLANWSSSYLGWNQFPSLPDLFTPPSGGGWGENTPENIAIYMDRCWPDYDHIVRRITEARADWEERTGDHLKRLYLLTNGEREWLDGLKEKIDASGAPWEKISSSKDMSLTNEQTYVAQAIDMAIAERAAVFIGNGFSSLTANVILLRAVRQFPMYSNRFW